MFQRIIRSLRQKDLLASGGVIFALIVVLSIIIILGQFFHQSLQDEMAGQFNAQQLLLARQVAMNIESMVDHVYKNIRVISQLPDIDRVHLNAQSRSAVESIAMGLRNEALVTIRILDRNGVLRYDSAFPGRERVDLSHTDYFNQARTLPKNEKLVTDLLEIHTNEDTKEFIVAVPIYRQPKKSYAQEFSGVVVAVLSMEGVTQRYLAPIKSGSRGYAWMMDSEGTLLYHPTQPQMVGRNLYMPDSVCGSDVTCFNCHRSFDTEKKMIEGNVDTFGHYQAPGGENKLAAFYKMPIGRKFWVVVVSAPYSDVIELMQKSRRFYSLLILAIFITTFVASAATIVTYKKKIKVEEKEKHLENQRRLEREIEISKNCLENIIENTKTNLMVLDKELIVRTANSAQARTLGRPKQQVLGKPFFTLFPGRLAPYDGIPIEAILQKTLEGRTFELRDYKVTGLQQSPLFFTMTISPLLVDGKTPGILVTSNDVTKRVELEAALTRYTVELEDKVDKGTATAKKLEQQVLHSDKLAALGRLAAGVAHEIGNPLTSISSFAQMMREMSQDDFTQKSLDVINTHIQRITDIVRRMATFARADSLTIKNVQINDVVNATLDLMRLDKRMKSSVQITTSLDPDIPKILIDEGQISQVFINIIINALDAMADGGTLVVGSRRGLDDHGNDAVMVSFADSGTGIPPAEIQKIFDPFYTTKEAGKGTGLGLSLSYDIVRRFKGDIHVESEVGKGTVFTILLPLEAQPTANG
jgi:PAS domain S-box-containing protein